MEIELKGIEDFKSAVDALREASTRIGMFAKTMMMAADKMDEALSAHIQQMESHATRLETIEFNARQREDYAQLGRSHGQSSRS